MGEKGIGKDRGLLCNIILY